MQFPSSLASSWTSAQMMIGKFDHSELRKKARQCFHAYITNRKLVISTVLFFLLLLYFFPGWFGIGSSVSTSPGASTHCLDDQLRHYYRLEHSSQVHTQHYPVNPQEKAFVPFVGNGRIGIAFGADQQLRVSAKRSLSATTNLYPLINAAVNHARAASAFVTDYQKGQMKKIDCYAYGDECVSVITTVYAHRKYPHLLIQDIQIANPLAHSIEVSFSRPSNNWREIDRTVDGMAAKVLTSSVDSGSDSMAIAALMTNVPDTINVQGKRQENIRFMAVIDYSEPIVSDRVEGQKNIVADRVIKLHRDASRITGAKMDQEHETAWRTLNEAAFGISLSLAPDALNADLINATRYAIMTNSRAPLVEDGVSDGERRRLLAELSKTELCYNGPSTISLLPSRLWRSLATISDLLEVVDTWVLTLEKNGCMHLVRAGASGTAQAMLLSFGTLKFSHHHLEFDVDPSDLHRDYSYTGILLDGSEGPKVSIWVEVGNDNKAVLYASVERSNPNKRVFACDAGCLDAPIELKEGKTQFPVKQTLPLTPILYITSDKSHLEELKQTIHVKEVAIAPAHEHHVLALHKHGHRLGGLPTLFWVTLAFLIIAFHLFLFKLVYNEWLRGDTKTYSRYGRERYVS